MRAVGRKSGQLDTVQLAGSCQLASFLVHRFQAMHPLRRLKLELLADQALIDGRPARSCRDNQLDSRRSQRAIQRCQAWVRVGSLELRDGCLADPQSLREIRLRQACSPSRVREEPAGDRR
jgi:hypothetical protein